MPVLWDPLVHWDRFRDLACREAGTSPLDYAGLFQSPGSAGGEASAALAAAALRLFAIIIEAMKARTAASKKKTAMPPITSVPVPMPLSSEDLFAAAGGFVGVAVG